jgi:hypothetical protein
MESTVAALIRTLGTGRAIPVGRRPPRDAYQRLLDGAPADEPGHHDCSALQLVALSLRGRLRRLSDVEEQR